MDVGKVISDLKRRFQWDYGIELDQKILEETIRELCDQKLKDDIRNTIRDFSVPRLREALELLKREPIPEAGLTVEKPSESKVEHSPAKRGRARKGTSGRRKASKS